MRIAGAADQCSVPGVTKNVSQQESGECRVTTVSTVSSVVIKTAPPPVEIFATMREEWVWDRWLQLEIIRWKVYLVLSCPIKYEGSAQLPTFSISLQDAVSCTTSTNIGLS